jgi:hypothetical protein
MELLRQRYRICSNNCNSNNQRMIMTVESLRHEELIALRLLQGGLATRKRDYLPELEPSPKIVIAVTKNAAEGKKQDEQPQKRPKESE